MRAHFAGFILCLTLMTQSTASAAEPVTAIRLGRLIDGRGAVIVNPVVIVRGERIERIALPGDVLPQDATVIDLGRFTGVPGLIDVHTHMTLYWDRTPGTKPWSQLGSLGAAVTVSPGVCRRRGRGHHAPAGRPRRVPLTRLTGEWGAQLGIGVFLTYLIPPTLLFIPLPKIVAGLGLQD